MTEARQIFIDWANNQVGWIRLVAKEVIDTRSPIPTETLEEIFKHFLIEKGLESGVAPQIESLNFVEQTNTTVEKFYLKEISHVANVNRLITDQVVQFNPDITVIFGENASGKSGYVRILKRLAATRSQEEILPDITKSIAPGNPKAVIAYTIGDKDLTFNWNGETGVAPFNRVNIFDSRALISHVDENLTYVYTPRDLSLFKLAHSAIEWVRIRLESDIKKRKPTSNPFITRFGNDTSIYTKIETLGPTTDLTELETLAQLGQEEEAQIMPLREQIESLNPQVVATKLDVAENRRTLLVQGIELSEIIKSFNWVEYNSLVTRLDKAKDKHVQATEKAFLGENIPGMLTESWKKFIEAGDIFLKENGAMEYPAKGNPCIYCRQPLESAAVDLLEKYKAYCNNSLKTDINRIEQEIQAFAGSLTYPDIEDYIKTLEKGLGHTESPNRELLELKLNFAANYKEVLNAYKRMQSIDIAALGEKAEKVFSECTKLLFSTDELITNLKKQGEDRQVALMNSLPKLKSLEARKVLKGIFSEIKEHVERAKWANKAESILGTFTALLRSLTAQTKVASEDLLNKDFQMFFEQESSALKAPAVRLDFPGQKGESTRRKSLSARYRLSDILSEGEQKVIALADFLAETSIRKISSPLVFDDPVNSLDYKRMEYIIDRIHELSKTQQIIVFTHNIWFAASLLSRFDEDRQRCTYYDIAESNGVPGYVRPGSHPRWDTVKILKGKINSMIQTASTLHGEEQTALVENAYGVIRSWCEVVVEQELLFKVAQRYAPNISMSGLNKIKVDRLTPAITAINNVFEKCCRIMPGHSQPLETLGIRVTLDELKADWKTAQEALEAYQK